MLDFDNENNLGVAMCDSCEEEISIMTNSFDGLVSAIRDEDWYIDYTNAGYEHYCPECSDTLSFKE